MKGKSIITLLQCSVIVGLLVTCLSACVYMGHGPGRVWTHGYWKHGYWVPGHWQYAQGEVWVPGHWNRWGNWVPGHWR